MIKIVFKNGCVVKWKKKEYTDYKYGRKCLIIIKKRNGLHFIIMDSVVSIIVK